MRTPCWRKRTPRLKTRPPRNPDALKYLLLSARSEAALAERARTFQSYLAAASAGLHDIAYTAAARRSHHTYRLAVTGASSAEWADALRAFLAGEARRGTSDGRVRDRANWRRPVFVFSGMGQQHARMGHELFRPSPSSTTRFWPLTPNCGATSPFPSPMSSLAAPPK